MHLRTNTHAHAKTPSFRSMIDLQQIYGQVLSAGGASVFPTVKLIDRARSVVLTPGWKSFSTGAITKILLLKTHGQRFRFSWLGMGVQIFYLSKSSPHDSITNQSECHFLCGFIHLLLFKGVIYLWLCWVLLHGLFSSCGKSGPLFIGVCELPNVVASLVAKHRLYANGHQWLQHMSSVAPWDIGSSWTSVHTHGPWIGRQAQPLDHQGSPHSFTSPFNLSLNFLSTDHEGSWHTRHPSRYFWDRNGTGGSLHSWNSQPGGKIMLRKICISLAFILLPDFSHPTSHHHLEVSSIQSLSHVWLFVTPWTAACQAFLSITNSQSLLKLMSIESLMPSSHVILCHPLLLPPSIFPSIRVSSTESVLHIRWPKYWSFSFSTSSSNE